MFVLVGWCQLRCRSCSPSRPHPLHELHLGPAVLALLLGEVLYLHDLDAAKLPALDVAHQVHLRQGKRAMSED